MRKLSCSVAVAVMATLYAGFAAAHAVLISSSPASGSVLSQAPREIRLSFSEGIEARFSSVSLFRSDGRKVQSGRAISSQKRGELIVSLPELQPGKYQVRWQTTSSDSHRIQGNFSFEIRQ